MDLYREVKYLFKEHEMRLLSLNTRILTNVRNTKTGEHNKWVLEGLYRLRDI